MTTRQDIDRLVRVRERGVISSVEFFSSMMELLWKLPPHEKREVLQALANHEHHGVQGEVARLQEFVLHEELSKDFDYVQEHSPLQPGTRVTLSGGYDYHASEGHPRWLNGRACYEATFLRFARRGENKVPVALVEFDEPIDMPGHTGRYGVLLCSYSTRSFAWGWTDDVVTVHVVEALPDDVAGFCAARPSETALETHASYRIV